MSKTKEQLRTSKPVSRGYEAIYWKEILEQQDRFWAKVQKTENCWIWTGCLQRGYGTFKVRKRMIRAYRISWSLFNNQPVSRELVMDHLCRNPACVNPKHLEPVSQKENVLRGVGPTAKNSNKTHCSNGHEFTPENTGFRNATDKNRYCRECKLIRDRKSKKCRFKKYAARIKSLEETLSTRDEEVRVLREYKVAALAELLRFREALEWYAGWVGPDKDIVSERAREALTPNPGTDKNGEMK